MENFGNNSSLRSYPSSELSAYYSNPSYSSQNPMPYSSLSQSYSGASTNSSSSFTPQGSISGNCDKSGCEYAARIGFEWKF